MFESSKKRYLTSGVDAEIPLELQMYLWQCVDNMPEPKDYLQVFSLSNMNGIQRIQHTSEKPKHNMEHFLPIIENPVTAKVYIIDDGDYCTMLLAEEY